MKKQLVLIGIIAILVSVGFSGCTTSEEKILGRWTGLIPNTSITLIMNFFTNGSFYEALNETNVIWGTYTMNGKTIVLQYGDVINKFEYSFSDFDNKLTFIKTDGELFIVLTKQ